MMRLLTLLFLMNACTSTPTTEIRDREWKLASVGSISSMPSGAPPTLRFEADGRVSANTGCNSAGGAYTIDGDRLTIANVFSTKRACVDQARNELEAAYLDALRRTSSFRIVDGQLELLGADGAVLARFH